jgi:hypothetical protein
MAYGYRRDNSDHRRDRIHELGESALALALSVASLINGPILGVFLVGTF